MAVNSTGEYRPWERAGQMLVSSKGGARELPEPSDPFIVLRQGTAENLSLSVVPKRMQNVMGLNVHILVPSNMSSSAKLPQPFLKSSLRPAHTTPTLCTHQQAPMQEGESAQCRDWVVQNHWF